MSPHQPRDSNTSSGQLRGRPSHASHTPPLQRTVIRQNPDSAAGASAYNNNAVNGTKWNTFVDVVANAKTLEIKPQDGPIDRNNMDLYHRKKNSAESIMQRQHEQSAPKKSGPYKPHKSGVYEPQIVNGQSLC